ncbi:MAG TPA: hypothetical protein VE641_21340 [Chthoniobacterales bacterium]|nr:hypothetical protein [Chthoniobacterales bacterium]
MKRCIVASPEVSREVLSKWNLHGNRFTIKGNQILQVQTQQASSAF